MIFVKLTSYITQLKLIGTQSIGTHELVTTIRNISHLLRDHLLRSCPLFLE